ncbi:MAG: hypothetical protein RLZZ352_737 [Pseudomonadota bacterium]|jgi:hypothetical protein
MKFSGLVRLTLALALSGPVQAQAPAVLSTASPQPPATADAWTVPWLWEPGMEHSPPLPLRDVLRQPSALRDEALKPHRLTEQERQRMREQLRKPNPLNETGKP